MAMRGFMVVIPMIRLSLKADSSASLRNDKNKVPRLGSFDVEAFAEGAQRLVDAVDLSRVPKVGEPVDLLLCCPDTPGEFGRANLLPQHFSQQQNLGC